MKEAPRGTATPIVNRFLSYKMNTFCPYHTMQLLEPTLIGNGKKFKAPREYRNQRRMKVKLLSLTPPLLKITRQVLLFWRRMLSFSRSPRKFTLRHYVVGRPFKQRNVRFRAIKMKVPLFPLKLTLNILVGMIVKTTLHLTPVLTITVNVIKEQLKYLASLRLK